MQVLNLVQGTPEWHAHRATHFNASDAPAMMGCSPYKTRQDLIKELATGMTPEVDAATQRRFDEGHRSEALARPVAEGIMGIDLYPITGKEGKYSASFDGLSMDEISAFEHKAMNDTLRGVLVDGCDGSALPLLYRVQMEQQCMVSNCNRVLFMASKWQGDTLDEERHCWYYPDLALRAQIVAGWAQLEADVAAYVPSTPAVPIVAAAVTSLPSISVQVSGSIAVKGQPGRVEVALRDFIEHRLIRKPETDQQFADLDLQIKAMKGAEAALESIEVQLFSQVEAIDLAKRTKDMLHKLTRDNRLAAEKLLAARKDSIRLEIVQGASNAFWDHLKSLNQRLGAAYMPAVPADFAGVIKGKRTIDSLRGAVADELARAKIEANAIADRIQLNLRTLEASSEHSGLFADRAALVLKQPDDLAAVVNSRIMQANVEETARREALREKIRAEEQAKAQAEADEKIAAAARAAATEAKLQEQARQFEEQEALEIARIAKLNSTLIHAETSLAVADAIVTGTGVATATFVDGAFVVKHVPVANVIPMTRPAAPAAGTPPTLKLGQISERLGFGITADFLRTLGFEIVAKERASCLYHNADFPLMCAALIKHIQAVQAQQAA